MKLQASSRLSHLKLGATPSNVIFNKESNRFITSRKLLKSGSLTSNPYAVVHGPGTELDLDSNKFES
jgi:hypothetical protein